jgi:hypothetical protein
MKFTQPKRSNPDAASPPLSDSEASQAVASANWYHRFELRPGLMTPGC